MQERKEPEHLARSSSGVTIQGLCYWGPILVFGSVSCLKKILKQNGMVPLYCEFKHTTTTTKKSRQVEAISSEKGFTFTSTAQVYMCVFN